MSGSICGTSRSLRQQPATPTARAVPSGPERRSWLIVVAGRTSAMPASVQVGLLRALASLPENFNPNRWVELLSSVRTIAAFEGLLRGKQCGRQLYVNSLHFLRAGGVVEDTSCLIGDLIEVVADIGDVRRRQRWQEQEQNGDRSEDSPAAAITTGIRLRMHRRPRLPQ